MKAAVAKIPVSAQTPLFRVNRRQRKQLNSAANAGADTNNSPETAVLRCSRFAQLPLSEATRDALAAAKFDMLTPIQQTAIPQALAGRDVLAAAPTGSGKTLAFLVPLIESLWRSKWSVDDRLGAIVLAPTRELALQIFEVLRKVAHYHALSAGLVIGGKQFEGERDRVGFMNILVATPGRLLHHLDTAADIQCNSLQMLVLDEADRILDMGFARTIDAILEHLPKDRQTLLFSATQTKSVKDLARLSLRSPQYLSVMARTEEERVEMEENGDDGERIGENEQGDTDVVGIPLRIIQSYAVIPSHDKLGVLWSFIKANLKAKIIVFFATGKQVRFAFDSFCKMRPGLSILHMHGKMKQGKRTEMYQAFIRTKNAVLFATDVASRGLDFPNIDWVVQLDCPDNVETYIHRVGRTARFQSNGKGMLFLCEGKETKFVERLAEKGINPKKARINSTKMVSDVTPHIAATVASNKELKYLAQRAFLFYLKSVFQQSDKEVFDATEHDIELLAKSFGLSVTPQVSFKASASSNKDQGKTVFGYRPRTETKKRPAPKSEPDEKEGKDSEQTRAIDIDDGSDEEDLLTLKQVHEPEGGDGEEVGDSAVAEPKPRKRKRIKLDLLGRMPSVNRIVFDDEGNALRASEVVEDEDMDDESTSDEAEEHDDMDAYANKVAKRLAAREEEDKERERTRVRAKHAKRKEKRRKLNKALQPNADIQQRMMAHEAENRSDSEAESSLADEQDLALRILEESRER